jgi:hypothetical protein
LKQLFETERLEDIEVEMNMALKESQRDGSEKLN